MYVYVKDTGPHVLLPASVRLRVVDYDIIDTTMVAMGTVCREDNQLHGRITVGVLPARKMRLPGFVDLYIPDIWNNKWMRAHRAAWNIPGVTVRASTSGEVYVLIHTTTDAVIEAPEDE